MLTPTNYTVKTSLFQEACHHLPKSGMKTTINQPTGDFFYDSWVIKDEYKGTVWETIYNSLPVSKGEARIIILDPNQCYQIHADIDDRYHLNIIGDNSYLIDLVRDTMYPLVQDGIWYDMDASFLHTAANFGRKARVQLVVRKLLKKNKLKNPIEVSLATSMNNSNHARFLFDNTMSSWFNDANKAGIINSFTQGDVSITFNIEQDNLELFKRILPKEFKIL
jgi:Aspartyl/Asparaginyl beta-hydroxylase